MNLSKILNDSALTLVKEPADPYAYYLYGVTPPVTPRRIAVDEAFTRNTKAVSYSEEIHHIFNAMALAKMVLNTETVQNFDSIRTFEDRDQQHHIETPENDYSTSLVDLSERLLASDSGPAPIDMGQSPEQKLDRQSEDTGISEDHTSGEDHTSSEDRVSARITSSPKPSGSLAEKIKILEEFMVNDSLSPIPSDVDTDIGKHIDTTTPSMSQDEGHGPSAIFTDIENHFESVTPSRVQRHRQTSSAESSNSSAKMNNNGDLVAPVTPQRGMLRGGRAPSVRSPMNLGSQVFAPSPLNHAHPVPPLFLDGSTKEGSPNTHASEIQIQNSVQPSHAVNQDLAHPSLSGYSQSALSYPSPIQHQRYSLSAASETGSRSPSGKDEEMTKSPNSFIAGFEPFRKVRRDSSPFYGQSVTSPDSSKNGDVTTVSDKITATFQPLRHTPSLTFSTPANGKKSRIGPPVNLYSQAILTLVDAVPSRSTPPRPTSFSPISPEHPPPRPRKRARRGETAVDEDPFENFTSGSEKDDEEDEDFAGGVAPSSPSVQTISDRSLTPPDDDDYMVTGSRKKKNDGKERAAARASCEGKPNRFEVRAEKSGAKTVGEVKPKVARRSNGLGDWPTAALAHKDVAEERGVKETATVNKRRFSTPTERQTEGADVGDDGEEERGVEVQNAGKSKKAWAPKYGVTGFGTTTSLSTEDVYPADLSSEVEEVEAQQSPPRKKKEVKQIRSPGRNGSGWTLVAEKIEGKRKVSWKMQA